MALANMKMCFMIYCVLNEFHLKYYEKDTLTQDMSFALFF